MMLSLLGNKGINVARLRSTHKFVKQIKSGSPEARIFVFKNFRSITSPNGEFYYQDVWI